MLGEKIKELRTKKNISQKELADRLFVSDKTVSSWEINRTEPSLDLVVEICNILDVSVAKFLYEDNKNNIETEIKVKISEDEYNTLKSFLDKNAEFVKNNHQLDTYYEPTYRKFVPEDMSQSVDEWLRIGERGNRTILNYKHWHEDKYCDEYEVEIDNKENLDKIFGVLGLNKIAVVDKVRLTYLYLGKYEIALDFVKDLGHFVEIEVKKYESSALEEYDNLISLTKELNINLANIDKRGYPYHVIFNNRK